MQTKIFKQFYPNALQDWLCWSSAVKSNKAIVQIIAKIT